MRLNTKPIRYGAAFAGALLLAWEKLWWLIGWWADVDFVSQKAGGVSNVVSFLASPGFGNVANLIGIALIILAFLMVERRQESPSDAPPSEALSRQDHPMDKGQPLARLGTPLPVTPKQLFDLFEGRTALQAQSLIEPYIGKVLAISGTVRTVSAHGTVMIDVAPRTIAAPQINLRFVESSSVYLAMLHEGSRIDAVGKITSLSAYWLDLEECEITHFDPSKPEQPAR